MSTAEFYDALAPYYHLIYEDWPSSIERQGAALDSIIRSSAKRPLRSVLDVACGIGTQSLGLAIRGYTVVGSDVSVDAVHRARFEAASRGLDLKFSVADMRSAHAHHARAFDVVICADNSLPHLLSAEEMTQALHEFFLCTRSGGLCIISLRDYAIEDRRGTQVKSYGVRGSGRDRYILFQVWTWRDPLYDFSFYIVHDAGGDMCSTVVARCTYYAVLVEEVILLMQKVGFVDVRRIDDKFFQPVVVGARVDAP